MRILGIDQSLTSSGLVVLDAGAIDLVETLKPGKVRGFQRVQMILDRAEALALDCDAVAMEGPAMHAQGRALTGLFGLYGCLTQRLWQVGREPWIVSPTARARYATGKGNAGKDLVLASVIRRYDDERILGNDVADALVIAALIARRLGEPLEVEGHLPKTCLEALEKVQAPGEWDEREATARASH